MKDMISSSLKMFEVDFDILVCILGGRERGSGGRAVITGSMARGLLRLKTGSGLGSCMAKDGDKLKWVLTLH